jgi:formylglycine-generating enzyme required for sulfatase activity
MVDATQQPIEVFFSYSREDENLRKKLETHLSGLRMFGVKLLPWHDRQIEGGSEWEEEIIRHMQSAHIILLLISPDFIHSEYCFDKEMPMAIARHDIGEAYVIPILLRPVAAWEEMPFARLQLYPSGGIAVTEWSNQDSAFVNVVNGIKTAVEKLLQKREQARQAQEQQAQAKLKQQQQEQERLRAAALRQEQARIAEEARVAEQAKLAEQARIREAERQAENQRQQQARLERVAAADAKRAEKERQAELHRQQMAADFARHMDAPDPPRQQVVAQTRRKALQWLGYGSGAFVLTLVGQKALEMKRIQLQPFDFEVATVNAKGQESPRQRKQAQRFVEDLGNGVTLEMVSIPSGTFQMGSPTTEKGRSDNESPQHPVSVSAFSIGRYAVTQAQYEAIMGKNPSHFKGAKRPVEKVSWNDALEFCKKLSQKTGRIYRLPSEAEWEYACRAKTTTPFHFGETITTDLANYRGIDSVVFGENYPGNYKEASNGKFREQTTDGGIFPANAFGLSDMHGNVWEWCEDVYHENYAGAPKDGSAWNVGGDAGRRLVRGGSWDIIPASCRSAIRLNLTPDSRGITVGFRVVCSSARV